MIKHIMIAILITTTTGSSLWAGAAQKEIYSARDKVMPAVVHIQPVIKNYRTGELEKQAVVGSGVIFHPDGYVVTNYHVAGKSERILCTLEDKEVVPAEFIGGDPPTDIAVIKLNLEDYHGTIHVADFGNSDSTEVGQYVLAMGSPLSLSRSVSAGVVSTKDRYFSSDVRLPTGERTGRYNLWIQTDAAINPGNSGGPLVNMSGKVIGINSRASMFANNLGFAIPVNIVKEVTTAIMADGKVTRSWIGLHCQAMQEMEDYFGTEDNSGVLVSSIDAGSPAEAAFLKAGDVILEVDNQPVSARFIEELPNFYALIANREPGDDIELTVQRGSEEFRFSLQTKLLGDLQGEDFECKNWGFTVKAITRQMQIERQLDDTAGVLVVGVKRVGTADQGGLRRSDVVLSVNDHQLKGLDDFMPLYDQLSQKDAETIMLVVKRAGARRFVLLKTEDEQGESTDE
ncbi:MAG: trypsin-like peptidase domain-containing protein [candidate division Zixibacteria bacterium]|nr:trypsin-like peptidase domain-containing protein [candidate division Zixibacteria bacterium]MDH4035037.1 trypsin-like peptidase domain-containing protein [candidate division Zixibacteria bacterium]